MGHIANPDREYRLLQNRVDHTVTGAPDSPALMQILHLLYTPEEAQLARQIPTIPTPLRKLAGKMGLPEEELDGKVTELARRGVLMDFYYKDRRYVMLPPVVIGFFEFVFMRARNDLPMAELARLFDQYMHDGDRFANSVFGGNTQVGRSLVHETALPEGDHTEILDWERASRLIETASAVGLSLCACRHKKQHLGKACDAPMEVCMTLNSGAESMARNGIARLVSQEEGLRVLEECRNAGLAQTGDNVKRNVTYICNCCGCCCGMMEAAKTHVLRHPIVTSNWIMDVDEEKCRGCGKCVEACPINAIEVKQTSPESKKKKAVRDADLCLGCGVCHAACKFGGISMKARERRVFTPETTFDRVVTMAIERGKLAQIVFEDPEKLSHRALSRIFGILEKTPPWKAAMNVQPLRSAFLKAMLGSAAPTARQFKD